MNQIDAGHDIEQLASDMRHGSDANRCHVYLARIGFRIGDKLGTVVAGTDGLTTMTFGERVRAATGAMSRTKL